MPSKWASVIGAIQDAERHPNVSRLRFGRLRLWMAIIVLVVIVLGFLLAAILAVIDEPIDVGSLVAAVVGAAAFAAIGIGSVAKWSRAVRADEEGAL